MSTLPCEPAPAAAFRPEGLAAWFRRRAHRSGDRPALSGAHQAWTYATAQREVEQLSAALHTAGLRHGERLAYLGSNHPLVFLLWLAAARLGAILVPLNTRLAAPEIAAIVADAGATMMVGDASHAELVDGLPLPLQRLAWGHERAGWLSLAAMVNAVREIPPEHPSQADEVALLIYTSGTSGRPKGVMLTHANLWANNLNWLLACDLSSTDVTLNTAPLFHVGGLCVVSLPTLMAGGHLIVQDGFEAGAFLAAVERHRASVTFAVPAMLLFASQHAHFESADLSSLRLVVVGGAPVPEPLLRTYQARHVPISQCYGLTEATSGVTFLETRRALSHLGSCGREGLLTEVRLVDPQGRPISRPGERGELCVRGANITPGYWRMPQETARAFDAEGWFHTGDGAYFNEEGFYTLCDRLKDMVISGGENVYPAEVEAVLYEHPAVAEVAVIGAPDARWGEHVVAVVVSKPGPALTLAEVQAHCEGRLAHYKIPRELRKVWQLPRNANGKVDKQALRKAAPR